MATFKLNSGYEMPAVGLGTWEAKPGEVGEAVKAAVKVGYRHIDCAAYYGNETEIGAALQELFSQGVVRREELFIVSKLWNNSHHPDDVKPTLQKTLRDLQLTYLDLYFIHWPMAYKRGPEFTPMDEAGNILYDDISYVPTWKEMEKCVDEGLIRSLGLSNFNSQQIQEVIDNARIQPAVLQVELHPYLQQQKLVEFCEQRNILVTSYFSFCSPQWVPKTVCPKLPPVFSDQCLVSIAAKYNKTPAQVILRWLYQRRIVTIPKSVSPDRLKQNIAIFDFELSRDDMVAIKTIDKNTRLNANYEERDGKIQLRDNEVPFFPFNIEF